MLLLSRLARETVTVALSGQGADEVLGGYRKHQVAHAADLLGRVPPARGAVALAARVGAPESARARGLRALSSRDPVERMLAMSRVVQPRERLALFTPEFLTDADVGAPVRGHGDLSGRSILTQTLYLDSRLALVDNMLLYFDKMSMATSLEVRVPFLDHDVVSFCLALPDSRKVRRGNRKELLKRVSRGLVADEIVDKRKRGFFRSALGTWLQRSAGRTAGGDPARPAHRPSAGSTARPRCGGCWRVAGGGDIKADQRLFCLFLLERWMREWVDAPAPAPGREGRRLGLTASARRIARPSRC